MGADSWIEGPLLPSVSQSYRATAGRWFLSHCTCGPPQRYLTERTVVTAVHCSRFSCSPLATEATELGHALGWANTGLWQTVPQDNPIHSVSVFVGTWENCHFQPALQLGGLLLLGGMWMKIILMFPVMALKDILNVQLSCCGSRPWRPDV